MDEMTLNVKVVPEIDQEALLAAVLEVISGHAVVKPGETLVARVRDWSPLQVEAYQDYMDVRGAELGFRVLVVAGDELAVAKPFDEHAAEALAVAKPEAAGPFADKAARLGG